MLFLVSHVGGREEGGGGRRKEGRFGWQLGIMKRPVIIRQVGPSLVNTEFDAIFGMSRGGRREEGGGRREEGGGRREEEGLFF
jgi:hypothetical protein